ncbi:MAG: radical SAM protein [Aigarchaeota archaeon]|nr:radical SAM protein [Aigarchaeota archaeon]MDW7986581.1 radical SAM protein [Nitrososphaerota archaeon]
MSSTQLIKLFDPWRSKLCTCPVKYSFDPYTGCAHRCLYCYASSYIRDFYNCRPKKNLLKIIRRDLEKLPENTIISMSNSSDPYPWMERELKLTRRCLEEFMKSNLRILVVTKSDLVVRDIDLLKELRVAVTISITTIDDWLAKKIEPLAPAPSKRLKALSKLSEEGVNTGLRLDPIIPFINDDNYRELLIEARNCGVKHVVSSLFKPRYDSWTRVVSSFPEIEDSLRKIYFLEGERIGRSWYASRELRFRTMKKVSEECKRLGLGFATCREGFEELHTSQTCDGSHLIRKTI